MVSSAWQCRSTCDYNCVSASPGARPSRSSTAHIQSWGRFLDSSKREVLGRLNELGGQLVEVLVFWQVQRKAAGADAREAIQRPMIFADAEVWQARKAARRQAEEPAHPPKQHKPLSIRDLLDIFPEEHDYLRILHAMLRLKSPRRCRAKHIRPRQGTMHREHTLTLEYGDSYWARCCHWHASTRSSPKMAMRRSWKVSKDSLSAGTISWKPAEREFVELECMTNRARVVALEYETNASRGFLRGGEHMEHLCR